VGNLGRHLQAKADNSTFLINTNKSEILKSILFFKAELFSLLPPSQDPLPDEASDMFSSFDVFPPVQKVLRSALTLGNSPLKVPYTGK
jgi:hypothetical protein